MAALFQPRAVLAMFAVAAAAGSLSSCGETIGPSLSVQVNDREARTPTATPTNAVPNVSALCCCRVNGTVQNTSTVPVHVSLRWEALGPGRVALPGPADVFVENIAPGATRRFASVPFFYACNEIVDHVRIRTDLIGLWTPER